MKAKWIWYPSEFEFFQYNKLMLRRTIRDQLVIPSWKVDAVYSCVRFRRRFMLTCPQTVRIDAEGELSVFLDGDFNVQENFDGYLTIGAGEHELLLTVYNPNGLPCVLVRGGGIDSDGSWQANCGTRAWPQAEFRDFDGKDNTPNSYALPTRPVSPVAVRAFGQGTLYSFSHEMLAYARLEGIKGKGNIRLYYGETEREALDWENCEVCESVSVGGSCARSACTRAFRAVYVVCGDGVSADSLTADEEYRPLQQLGHFACSDSRFNDIYEMSLRTLTLNMREFLLDGIKRDRWVWAGDVYSCLYYDYYTYFDAEIVESSLIALLGKHPPEIHTNFIMDYSFYMILAARDHYRYTGRKEFISRIFDRLVDLMDFCLCNRNEDGWMQRKGEEWIFIDWAEMPKDGECAFEQVLLCEALYALGELAGAIGRAGELYSRMAEEYRLRIRQTFWRGQEVCYAHSRERDGSFPELTTRYADIFAVRFGQTNAEENACIARKLAGKRAQAITTPYMKFFELDAMGRLGLVKEMLQEISDYWGALVELGADCVWEEFNPQDADSVGTVIAGRKYGMSKCHAWGSGPLYLFSRYVAGIDILGPACASFTVRPELDALDSFSCAVPTAKGIVSAEYADGRLTVCSEGLSGRLYLPDGYRAAGAHTQADTDGIPVLPGEPCVIRLKRRDCIA